MILRTGAASSGLVVRHHATHQDAGSYAAAACGHHLQDDAAVIDEYLVTRGNVGRQAGIGGRRLAGVAGNIVGGDGEFLAGAQHGRPGGEGPQADLGSLQVDKDPDAAAGLVRGGTHGLVSPQMVSPRAMTHVEPGNIHAGCHQPGDLLAARGRWPKGAHDLCPAAHGRCPPLNGGGPESEITRVPTSNPSLWFSCVSRVASEAR
jgi:hypothetical protein